VKLHGNFKEMGVAEDGEGNRRKKKGRRSGGKDASTEMRRKATGSGGVTSIGPYRLGEGQKRPHGRGANGELGEKGEEKAGRMTHRAIGKVR